MLISNEKLNIDTPNVGAKDDLVKTLASNDKEGNAKVSEIGLSQLGTRTLIICINYRLVLLSKTLLPFILELKNVLNCFLHQ
ncbi:hypothetical protein RS130_08875 [Paraglaciecola aquimarina]|uniref:Uncharacterized protein n=1 Tax=Paraglaciecola aquimarina TaxID=1235557 RepID=A0ABU3SVM0_9ALTE|nr:hypothetical protein [Paraglaciecola aquimarina]MDU0354032.1 hypothetical protein [Paraglaciecola aquimarina]